jgi:hypothetical protein
MTTEHITPQGQGNVPLTYVVRNVEEHTLARIGLLAPTPGGGSTRTQAAYITFEDGIEVNGKRVHPYDLIRFCDAILDRFTGDELRHARG